MSTQIHTVTNELRRRITSGMYKPGERLIELQLSAELGVSRTPIRLAFEKLTKEGLLERLPKRGFRVRAFDIQEVINAVDVRGTLEGMAARLAAERGMTEEDLRIMRDCVQEGQAVLDEAAKRDGLIDGARWSAMNATFHRVLVRAAGNSSLEAALDYISTAPLVGAAELVMHGDRPQLELEFAWRSQQDHVDIVAALAQREGSRAENLMREHARRSRDNKRRLFEEANGH
ncbi:MAG: GntR family transcriptional regulator [Pigmentiphaga sp.]